MITEWHRYCESNGCIETRHVGDQVEIRDTERPEATLLVPAKAWEDFLASVRAEAVGTARAEYAHHPDHGPIHDHRCPDSFYVRTVTVNTGPWLPLAEVRNNEGESR